MPATQIPKLDFLIIGGGIQGLTLLHQIQREKKGSALLVTRGPLGHGETLHSHGYLHRGYFLPSEEAKMIPNFMTSFDFWETWMREQGICYGESKPIYLDLALEELEPKTTIWRKYGLPFQCIQDLPQALQGGIYSLSGNRRFVKIQDRLIAPWEIAKQLSDPLQNLLLQGEVQKIIYDPQNKRVVNCMIQTRQGQWMIQPRFLILATGRNTQNLLKGITTANGAHPFSQTCSEINLIRDVPMVLVKGKTLPELSGWFYKNSPVAIMTHDTDKGERMWVVTIMEGHPNSRADFTDPEGEIEKPLIQKTISALMQLVPQLKRVLSQLQFSSYSGSKIDHPEEKHQWYIGDAGIQNLRFVWPVLWGLSYRAAQEIISSLPTDFSPHPASLPSIFKTGILTGEEKRFSPKLSWHSWQEWKTLYQITPV